MRRTTIGCAALLCAAVACGFVPASAARPLLDKHQWDAYFALYARDSNVPWKPATLRLDTYSGAPLDFAAYAVDPADVIVAGQGRTSRALVTAGRKPVVRWRFAPPAGYRFESSDVAVPLGTREGFYVVEARRGDAVQQIWLNRTHVGLVTKESPDGLFVWAADLRDGRALANMRVLFLVGSRLVTQKTDASGVVAWRDSSRPAFVLAEHGAGRAFVSLLPQAPLLPALVGLRLETAVSRAGGRIRVAGFVRTRSNGAYRRARGDARITLAGRGKTLSAARVPLDAAGAFEAELPVPQRAGAGDYAVLAAAAGAVGGTTVHVDAAGDLALTIRSTCPCDPAADVPFSVSAERDGVPVPGAPVRVRIVRTPHVLRPGAEESAPRWGTTLVYDATLHTGVEGRARIAIPSPSDGLDSTYGVRATTSGATATARIVVSNAPVALALETNSPNVDIGEPIVFGVRGFNAADGSAAGDLDVKLRLSHGVSVQERRVRLDAHGRAQAVFERASLGSNLALAEASVEGRRCFDATAVLVQPRALSGVAADTRNVVGITTDRERYRPGDSVVVRARAPGASGAALVTLEGARTYASALARVSQGSASARVPLGDAQGAVRVAATFVRDGALVTGSDDVHVDGLGHARATAIALEKAVFAAGDVLHATLRDGRLAGGATVVVRVSDGIQSGPALFDDAPAVLESGATTAQIPASAYPAWHAYVTPAHSRASDIFAAERPRKTSGEPSLVSAAPRTLLWRVSRSDGDTIDVPVPSEPGHFVLSIMKIYDDGDVGAASAGFDVA